MEIIENIYLHQIRMAQEFLNENHHADVSRVQSLLRKMLPKEFHDLIDAIKEGRDPMVFNVNSPQTLIAPQAQYVTSNYIDRLATEQELRDISNLSDHIKSVCRKTHVINSNMDLQIKKFSEIDLKEPFFDSLRASYPEFNSWYMKKAAEGATAYTYYINDQLKDFLYLKIENEELTDVTPILPRKRRLKVGTFKVENESRHTTRGERFMKKIMDMAIAENVDEIYVTIFPTKSLERLISMFRILGFEHIANKPHSGGTFEQVLVKDMRTIRNDFRLDYPFVNRGGQKYVLSIMPEYHTKLFPDSILKTEVKYDIIRDVSETNSIYKIYVCWMKDTRRLVPGDKLVIYRTTDNKGPASYRSVCTSVCTVCDVKVYDNFESEGEFVKYTNKYSVFSEDDLRKWYRTKKHFVVIKMLYNIAFNKKVINKTMKEKVGLNPNYWGFFQLTDIQFAKLLELGAINEHYIVD